MAEAMRNEVESAVATQGEVCTACGAHSPVLALLPAAEGHLQGYCVRCLSAGIRSVALLMSREPAVRNRRRIEYAA